MMVTGKRFTCLVIIAIMATATIPLFLKSEIFYPWGGTFVGALEGGAWPGMVLALDENSVFAFVLRIEKDGSIVEREDFSYLVAEVGPHSPDGQYSRIRFDLSLPFKEGPATPILMKPSRRGDTLTFEWSRRDERIVIGRILLPRDVRLSLTHYFPWERTGRYERLPDGQVQGRSGTEGNGRVYLFWSNAEGETVSSVGDTLSLSYDTGDQRSLHFVAAAGEQLRSVSDIIYRYKNPKTIDAFIEEEASAYEQKRAKIKGLYRGAPEAISDILNWMVLYQPGYHRLYSPAERDGLMAGDNERGDNWTISGGGSFLSALGLSLESSRLAMDAAKAGLDTQFPNGNVPGRRGSSGGTADRSQPPIGSYVILKLFQKLGDREFLESTYPFLQRWHAFWTARQSNGLARRDGNNDGLLEWGSDSELLGTNIPPSEKNATGRQRAAWESGQDDLPNWDGVPFNDQTRTLAMNCLDLNSLVALDSWCLAEISRILGRIDEAGRYLARYERLKALINEKLWNEAEGFYFDRYWDGRFSVHKAASNFYPLVARIADESKAQRMLKHLLDPKEFWGDYVVPSLSRDDPAFRAENQQKMRGSVRPETNYLLYQGLKAYGFDAVASEFAKKSVDIFLNTWLNYQVSPDSFNSLTGEAGPGRFRNGGPLFALLGVEEYLDFTPWEGFRFGMIKPDASGRLSRLFIQGRHYEVESSNSRTILSEEGVEIVSVDGPVVIRHFLYNESEVSFEIKSLKPRMIRLRFLKRGKYQLVVDGQTLDVFSGASKKFEIPGGEHSVLVQLLTNLEKQDGKPED